jgi:hypothetical protein
VPASISIKRRSIAAEQAASMSGSDIGSNVTPGYFHQLICQFTISIGSLAVLIMGIGRLHRWNVSQGPQTEHRQRARAEVISNDDRKLKGYIGEISENGFTLVDPKRGIVTTISYDEVRQVKNRTKSSLRSSEDIIHCMIDARRSVGHRAITRMTMARHKIGLSKIDDD